MVLELSHTVNCKQFYSEGLAEILAKIRSIDPLIWIFFFYASVKIIFFVILVLTNEIAVPDEGGYAQIVCYFNKGVPSLTEFGIYTSWSPLFLLPSQLFNILGIDCLAATRLTNLGFSLASGFMLLVLFLKFRRNYSKLDNKRFAEISVYSIFLFLPSKFFWTSIGIREAVIEFLLLTSIYLVYMALDSNKKRIQIAIYISLMFTLTLLSMSRWMLYICLLASILCFLILMHRKLYVKKFILVLLITLIASYFLPSFLAKTYANYLELSKKEKIVMLEKKKLTLISEELNSDKTTEREYEKVTNLPQSINSKIKNLSEKIAQLNQEIEEVKDSAASIPLRAYTIPDPEYSRTVRTKDARSHIATTSCAPGSANLIALVTCNLGHFPIGLYSVLLRPNPVQDWYSPSTMFASVENFIYLFFLLWLLMSLIRALRQRVTIRNALLPLIFLIFSISGLALYEGNVGTAFRHRSITVWAISVALLILICDRRSRYLKAPINS